MGGAVMVDRHGRESYFVVGEGWFTPEGGGRGGAEEVSLRVAGDSPIPPFRFSRLGPRAATHQLTDPTRKSLGVAMVQGGGGASRIPSGFTYLGQFIDHDLTF